MLAQADRESEIRLFLSSAHVFLTMVRVQFRDQWAALSPMSIAASSLPTEGTPTVMKPLNSAVMGLVLLGLASSVQADEHKIPLSEVPKAVIDAVKQKFPRAELKRP